jgi:hypothetical protein
MLAVPLKISLRSRCSRAGWREGLQQRLALRQRDALVRTACSAGAAQLLQQLLRLVLDVAEHVRDAVAAHLARELEAAVGLDAHAGDVGVAHQVVQVAEGFLVGAHQEDAEIVGLALDERVHRQRAPQAARLDEAVDLAVGVAGDVGEDRAARGCSVCRCTGMIGNTCSIAQTSGSDWNTEKLP